MVAPNFEQPIDRLLQLGPEALTDEEIVSILVRGRGCQSAEQRAHELLELFGGKIPGLLACNVAITRARQLSRTVSANLLASIELGRRLASFPDGIDLSDPKTATKAFHMQLRGATDQEILGAMFTDAAQRQLGYVECFRGPRGRLVIDTKTILREALCRNAVGILLFHLKPETGAPQPAQRDWGFLAEMRQACQTIGTDLVDYFVLTEDKWISLRGLRPW